VSPELLALALLLAQIVDIALRVHEFLRRHRADDES
jgi:hypothetical protein